MKKSNMMSTYLSIDIDFWNPYTYCGEDLDLISDMLVEGIIRPLTKRDVPIQAVMNHQQLLPEINQTEADTLINIDFHSDLSASACELLSCGSWVNFVRWSRSGTYEWYHSGTTGEGECATPTIFAEEEEEGKVQHPFWKAVYHKRVSEPPEHVIDDVSACGLCMSPQYSMGELMDLFREIVKEYDIPYRKGRMHEEYGRKLKRVRW